jgi:DNA-binding MarR family transcriptional regulator
MSDDDAGAHDTSLLFDVFALGQSVGRLLSEAMRQGPLTPAEYAVYSAIFELEAASPTRLAARLGMRLTTFVDQLRLIERRGHAARLDNPTDRRSYRVVLTTVGREAHRAANRQFEAADARFRALLPDGEQPAKAALRAIREAAEAARTVSASGLSPRRHAGRGG